MACKDGVYNAILGSLGIAKIMVFFPELVSQTYSLQQQVFKRKVYLETSSEIWL